MSEDDRDALLSALACRWQGGDVSAFGELHRMTLEADHLPTGVVGLAAR